jgi:hypothetical protein
MRLILANPHKYVQNFTPKLSPKTLNVWGSDLHASYKLLLYMHAPSLTNYADRAETADEHGLRRFWQHDRCGRTGLSSLRAITCTCAATVPRVQLTLAIRPLDQLDQIWKSSLLVGVTSPQRIHQAA